MTPASGTSLDVSWTEPTNSGSAISDHDVRYRTKTSGASWSPHQHTGTALETTLTGLTPGTTYEVQVRAENGAGKGDYSGSGEATTPSASGTISAAPNPCTIASDSTRCRAGAALCDGQEVSKRTATVRNSS